MCGVRQPRFISPQVESSGRLNERIKFSLVDAQATFSLSPLFCSNYPVSVYHLVFHRFHTLLYVRSNLALSFPRLNVVTKFLHVHDLYKDIDKIQISELYLKIQFFEIKIGMENGDFYKNIGQIFGVGCISIECLKTRTLKIFTIVMAIDRSR